MFFAFFDNCNKKDKLLCCNMNKRWRWKSSKTRLLTVGIVLVALVFILLTWNTNTIFEPARINISEYPPFEPDIVEDFPTVHANIPRIPWIIHQTFKDEMVYSYYLKYIKTFADLNPDWEYIFWTDESARKLIANKYSHLLSLFDSYPHYIMKSDVLRYVVLYEYGGVYADLDFECLRNLDRMTFKYACIFPPEPFEMTSIDRNWPYFINNAFMACRPKHPFLKQILDNLALYQVMDSLIDVAGPAFITSQFIRYNKLQSHYGYSRNYKQESNSPYFNKGELSEDHIDAVYVPNSKYFFNKLDDHSSRIKNLHTVCDLQFEHLKFNQRRACLELKRRFKMPRNQFALAEHHWIRFYESFFLSYIWYGKVHIKTVVERYIIYS